MQRSPKESILIRGARQNNLKNLTLELPTNELIVVTGVSGSGKSSLVFDTLYAEGQRRYVETFSPYARQFLDRMDKPQVDAIEGVPPAIAIDQVNPVRTSRSTVGTMTELNDHLKLLYARSARLYCCGCGLPVRRDTAQTIYEEVRRRAHEADDPRLTIAFPVPVPKNFSAEEVKGLLAAQGYTRFVHEERHVLEVVQDRLRTGSADRARMMEAFENALKIGQGRLNIHVEDGPRIWRFSSDLHCADCDIHYRDPTPGAFSFNSPIGACETCRGFGRVIGIDFGLVVPDESKTLRGGAIRPWQTASNSECQDDLVQYANKRGIPLDTPWRALTEEQRRWVLEGEQDWVSWRKSWPGTWYGVRRFFQWLETKAYKMHIRVLLSKYRAYTLCNTCGGARLQPQALYWRLGTREDADLALGGRPRFVPHGARFDTTVLERLPGLTLHDLMLLPIERCRAFIDRLDSVAHDEATILLVREARTRLAYLTTVGLGYLTLDRQSRTLSGGEVQRINLTTALGTSLVNTLFVLDEPSIGLHPRDMGRVVEVMHRLRDAGNTLVVVEHDPHVMLEADRVLDMGPGPGERGGEVVYFGTPEALKKAHTLTADYLSGRRRAGAHAPTPRRVPNGRSLQLLGVAHHNLKGMDVAIPLGCLVCITGVSGSGKSTLVQDILYPALLRAKGRPTEAPGHHHGLQGHEQVTDAVLVDQSPIGRTTRSTPASYVGAFDAIRNLYAALPLARERGYSAGTFSFNAGNGRCPACGGNGFEHIEMQFLSDVYLRCPDCDGRRYRREILELTLNGRSIADVLELTVNEALAVFASEPQVLRTLQPLADVGLDYLKLGQPVPTLSGGEAQRLKLAGHLAASMPAGRDSAKPASSAAKTAAGGVLFLFDEPTTGLHFDDVNKLLQAFRQLIAAGNSLVVIEHNLDVVRSADWIVDLGPEGGDAGGELVCAGPPEEVKASLRSHTGRALRDYEHALTGGAGKAERKVAEVHEIGAASRSADHAIHIHNAREHNLKNIDVALPRGSFTVITGVSGSGKSTLAFDILFAEGQRRYLESLNAYARQFVQAAPRPDVDAIFGIPPTVAIEQRVSRGGRKSTVATLTEIFHFLRLFYVKLGRQYCPDCNVPIEPQSEDAIAARILRDYRGMRVGLLAPLV
ncbi:MAG TPA: excinuclease ABC subunit UvrA, partial [Longimicrobiales bacterium]